MASEELIKDPLWDLLLSTNDCYPGCGCDADFFDLTFERVKYWCDNHDPLVNEVLNQINTLISDEKLDIDELGNQVQQIFGNHDQAVVWLKELRSMAEKAKENSQ